MTDRITVTGVTSTWRSINNPINMGLMGSACTSLSILNTCARLLMPALLFTLTLMTSTPSQAAPIHVLYERDTDGSAGNELAVVSYPTLADLIGNTITFTQFTQVDVSAAFSVGGITYDGTAYRVLYERDTDGSAGNELALVTYPTLPDLIGNTNAFTQFTQVDVSAAFSVGGFAYDSGVYRVLYERDAAGSAGNELALVSYPTLADLINNTSTFTQFTQVDVSDAFSVGGFFIETPGTNSVSEPGSLVLFVFGLVSLGFVVRRRAFFKG